MAGPTIPKNFRTVIVAAAVGNVIEWYDFYIFGSLAAILSVKFFDKTSPTAALLSTIALFTAGFLIRPLGAFLFGWMGDKVGRKYTFLLTLSGMGLGTGAIGLIPTYSVLVQESNCSCNDASLQIHSISPITRQLPDAECGSELSSEPIKCRARRTLEIIES